MVSRFWPGSIRTNAVTFPTHAIRATRSPSLPLRVKQSRVDRVTFLEGRLHSALFLACDARLLQIELALDASARLVGNFAPAQQLVDVFALGRNQFRPKVCGCGTSVDPI